MTGPSYQDNAVCQMSSKNKADGTTEQPNSPRSTEPGAARARPPPPRSNAPGAPTLASPKTRGHGNCVRSDGGGSLTPRFKRSAGHIPRGARPRGGQHCFRRGPRPALGRPGRDLIPPRPRSAACLPAVSGHPLLGSAERGGSAFPPPWNALPGLPGAPQRPGVPLPSGPLPPGPAVLCGVLSLQSPPR